MKNIECKCEQKDCENNNNGKCKNSYYWNFCLPINYYEKHII